MAVSLRIIRLTQRIDEGDRNAYDQLKALAKTDPDAKRVLRTVKEPPKPVMNRVKVAPQPKPDTPQQTAEKAKAGDQASLAALRKRAEYEDAAAQSALGLALISSDPEEARKWLIRSANLAESREALHRMAGKGDEKAKAWLEEHERKEAEPKPRRGDDIQAPVRDELGYYRPPTRHSKPRIGDVYRLNDAKLQTGRKNTTVVIKEMKGDFVKAWEVTREPGKRKCVKLIEPSLAGFASPSVYVLTDLDKVLRKDALAEYRGSLGPRDVKQFRLSA